MQESTKFIRMKGYGSKRSCLTAKMSKMIHTAKTRRKEMMKAQLPPNRAILSEGVDQGSRSRWADAAGRRSAPVPLQWNRPRSYEVCQFESFLPGNMALLFFVAIGFKTCVWCARSVIGGDRLLVGRDLPKGVACLQRSVQFCGKLL